MSEKQIITCPVCGSKRLKVGQFTYNTQEHNQEPEDNENEWESSDFCFDEHDLVVSVFCQGCSENGVDTDLTELAIQAGWDIYDEDAFKLIPKENTHEDDLERVPSQV
jgi:hypothetical protein